MIAPDHTPLPAGSLAVLTAGLSRARGRPTAVRVVAAEPLRSYSSHPIWRLAVTLNDGQRLDVVHKRLRAHPAKDVRREIRLYRRLLGDGRLGAPRLYASACDGRRGRYWLFLEDVGRRRLQWCDPDDWTPAFTWMARLHADHQGRDGQLRALGCLAVHGPRFWRGLAATAGASLRRRGQPGAGARFEALTRRWLEPAIAALGRQPRTLVHGDLSCHNVMVQPGGRIRPVDWEWAAIGVGAWDVSKLLAGWGARKPRFVAAYLDAFDRQAGDPLDRDAFAAALSQCDAMHQLWYLGWWIEPCAQPAYVERMLDRVERAWQALEEPGHATTGTAEDNHLGRG